MSSVVVAYLVPHLIYHTASEERIQPRSNAEEQAKIELYRWMLFDARVWLPTYGCMAPLKIPKR